MNNKLLQNLIMMILSLIIIISCDLLEEEESPTQPQYSQPEVQVNKNSIIPPSSFNRTNNSSGCLEVNSRNVRITLWDHGLIDGDIISFYVNGVKVVNNLTLPGPDNKYSFDITLDYNGYNYVLLYAHNLGDIPPNTVSVMMDDGTSNDSFVLQSNLSANDTWDIIVGGYGVTCNSSPQQGGSGKGDVSFWTDKDYGCGFITINVNGAGSKTLSSYFPSGGTPTCGDNGTATFTLSPGTYTWSASCDSYTWGPATITIKEDGCLTMRL